MTTPLYNETPTTHPVDPYTISCEGPECIYVLRFHGEEVDSGYDYGSMEAARILHAALEEAASYAEGDVHYPRCPGETYATYLAAAGAAYSAELDGKWVTAVGCPRCGGWHLREGR